MSLPLDRQREYSRPLAPSRFLLRREFHATARSLVMVSAYSMPRSVARHRLCGPATTGPGGHPLMTRITADVLIIGSGAAGGVLAATLADIRQTGRAAREGRPLHRVTSSPAGMGRHVLYAGRGARSTVDGDIVVSGGECVGGGTTVNYALAMDPVRGACGRDGARSRGLTGFSFDPVGVGLRRRGAQHGGLPGDVKTPHQRAHAAATRRSTTTTACSNAGCARGASRRSGSRSTCAGASAADSAPKDAPTTASSRRWSPTCRTPSPAACSSSTIAKSSGIDFERRTWRAGRHRARTPACGRRERGRGRTASSPAYSTSVRLLVLVSGGSVRKPRAAAALGPSRTLTIRSAAG